MTAPDSPSDAGFTFQPDPDLIRWRMYFRSPPEAVYQALVTAEGRGRFWAESAADRDGLIHFVVPGGLETRGRILEAVPYRRFACEYFGWTVGFDLEPAAGRQGTDVEMTCRGVPHADRSEVIAGWVSVLMAMKAAVDFHVDLRNHDPERTWWNGYADN